MKNKGRLCLLGLLILLQAGMVIGPYAYGRRFDSDRAITVRVNKGEPGKMVRGDFANLDLEISRIRINDNAYDGSFHRGEPVYVRLTKEGQAYIAAGLAKSLPMRLEANVVWIKGEIAAIDDTGKWAVAVVRDDGEVSRVVAARGDVLTVGMPVGFCVNQQGRALRQGSPSSVTSMGCSGAIVTGRVLEIERLNTTDLIVTYGLESYFIEELRTPKLLRDAEEIQLKTAVHSDGTPKAISLITDGAEVD